MRAAHEIVDQRIAGTGIASNRIGTAIDESHVRHAADIENCNRMRPVDSSNHGPMKHRHKRRTLAASLDIGLTEIVDHRNAEPLGELVRHRPPGW